MKVWLKFIIGIVLGVLIAVVAGADNTVFTNVTTFLTNLALQIGRYAAYPLLFFGLALGVYNLAVTKRVGKVLLFCFCFAIVLSFIFSLMGIASFFVANPSRISIPSESATELPVFSLAAFLTAALPSTPFASFTESVFMLPICLFAFFAGIGCASLEKQFAKQTLTVFDSLARVAYTVLTYFVDFYAILLIVVSISWTQDFGNLLSMGFFKDLIILLFVDLVILLVGVFPLIIKLMCRDVNPYKVLYAAIAPLIAGFFTGDANVGFVVNVRHCHESLGIRRRISNVATPLLTIFAKPGSTLVLTVSFLIIFKSYSSHTMGIKSLLLLALLATSFSLILSQFSRGGTYIALAAICLFFGSVYKQGYLVLKPAAFFLGSVATAIDTFAAMVGSYILAYQEDMLIEKDMRFFI